MMVENVELVETCARKDTASDGMAPVQLCCPVKPGDRPTRVGFVSDSTWSRLGRAIVPSGASTGVHEAV